MSTITPSSSSSDKHLEIFSLIWLDSTTNESRDTEQKLRSIINHVKKFEDVQQCQDYIQQISSEHRLVVIVSGQLGKEFLPSIHQLQQVYLIYVYCLDKQKNQQWTSQFTKIKGVIIDLDELVSQIIEDHKIYNKLEEPLSTNIFSSDGKSTTILNGQFVFFQLLIDCLLRLKSNHIDKNELINLYQNEYHQNFSQLNLLRQFEDDYCSTKALWWYTRESFFYKTLNAALRRQDIHMIFLLRSFIFDIYEQLQQYQSKEILRVYRYQNISKEEFDHLQKSIGQFISINSFFSTSKDDRLAKLILSGNISLINKEQVLFVIDADPKMVTKKPFADISQHSYFPSESEVLFMIGSIFRIENIYRDNDQTWIIKMSLCSDEENQLKQVLNYMKQQIGDGNTNLRILGKFLWKMGKLDLAETYFKRLLNEIPSDNSLLCDLYGDLGELTSQVGDLDMSIEWHKKALQLKEQNKLLDECNNQENIIDSNGMIRYGICHGTRHGGSPFNDSIQLKLLPMTSCIGVEVFWRPYLSSIRFIYQSDDISTRKIYHGDEGNPYKSQRSRSSEIFMLSMNERINKVTMYIGTGKTSRRYMCTANDEYVRYIRGIQFHTTNGRTTPLYGVDDEEKFTESYEGYTLGYVRGRSGLLIDMLQFIWYNENIYETIIDDASNETSDDVWQEAKDGLIPSDAVVGGEEDNRHVYIVRFTTKEGKMIQGKLIEGNKVAEGFYSGVQTSSIYQVLINPDQKREFRWVTTNAKNIPEGALQASKEQGTNLYVGRFVHPSGSTLVGKFSTSSGALRYTYEEQEKELLDEFEVLCVS